MINLLKPSGQQVNAALAALVLTASVLTGSGRPAEAVSSLTARFAEPVAGPGVAQTARLLVDFFPGNGEAITGLRVRVSGAAELTSADARRGVAMLQTGGFSVDYHDRGIGNMQSDTIDVGLLSAQAPVAFKLELLTNFDAENFRAQVPLTITSPLTASVKLEPAAVYAGETVELRLLVAPAAGEQRAIDSVRVLWPSTVVPQGAPTVHVEDGTIEVRQAVRVRRQATGRLPLQVHAAGSGLRASPVEAPDLQVAAQPTFEVRTADDVAAAPRLQLSEPARVSLIWRNDTDAPIAPGSLAASMAAGFVDVRLAEDSDRAAGVRLTADKEKGSVSLQVTPTATLEPGQSVAAHVLLTPAVAGPIVVTGTFQPPDRSTPVGLGPAVVQVAVRNADGSPSAARPHRLAATDLELARAGLAAQLRQGLNQLPLSRGADVSLAASRTDEGNWVVESLLTDLLLERGVRVMADSAAAGTLHYRLTDARVVYSPAGASLNPLDDSQRRDARMEVFLRLEAADGRVLWARRVSSQNTEARTKTAASWLGGAKGVDQVSVEPDHRAVEISLSGLIVGGLFFVFFAP